VRVGLPALLVREIASHKIQEDHGTIKALLDFSNTFVIINLSFICLILLCWVMLTKQLEDYESLLAYLIGFSIVALDSLRSIRLSAMQGLGKVALGQVPDSIITPSLLIFFSTTLYFYFGRNLSANWLLAAQSVSLLISFILGAYLLKKSLPSEFWRSQPQYQTKYWLKSSLPLGFLDLTQNTNRRIDIIILASTTGSHAVASYFIIDRIVFIIRFILASINTNIAPKVSGEYANNNIESVQRIVAKSTQISVLSATLISLIFIVFGNQILSIFDESYISDLNSLRLFCLAQLIQVAFGPVGLLLSMTGNARFTSSITLILIPLRIILNFLLLPKMGLVGAALVTIFCSTFSSLSAYIIVRKKIKVDTLKNYKIKSIKFYRYFK